MVGPSRAPRWRATRPHTVHGGLRERAGERTVRDAMARLAGHARAGRDALRAGDQAGFAAAVDASFDERHALLALDPRHVEMVRAARDAGASANYAGSGGAIMGALPRAGAPPVVAALRTLGCEMIAPIALRDASRWHTP